ncbi:MAG: PAS domain-containing sensor histidine kinase [Gemmatimonadota bacterium]
MPAHERTGGDDRAHAGIPRHLRAALTPAIRTPIDDLERTLDRAPGGFVTFDDARVILYANATLHETLGYEPGELVGRPFELLLSVSARIFFQTHLDPMLRLQQRADEIFLLMRTKSGGRIGMLMNAATHDVDGESVTDCVMLEVKERQKFEDELLRARRAAEDARATLEVQYKLLAEQSAALEAASRAKSDFLATMSHELRTPLNAIGGYTELMKMGIRGPITDAQRDDLTRIQKNQQHLLRLINEVLNLSRIESGAVDYEIGPVDPVQLVESVEPLLRPQIAAKGLTLVVEGVALDGTLVALGDTEKLQQVLVNLLSNAMKFTDEGGSIRVLFERVASVSDRIATPECILVQVRDTGIGIPAGRLGEVFEPFVQISSGLSRSHEGAGLGLAISRDLVRGMGGDLSAASVSGEGSTFTIALPTA